MNSYNIYSHPTNGHVAIKSGFSWPGFFFTWIWAISKKLWIVLLGALAAYTAMFMAEQPYAGLIFWAVALYCGFSGNNALRSSYIDHGWKFVGTVLQAKNQDSALSQYLTLEK